MSGNYYIPSMMEIKNIPWNGYNVVSTFSGGGGSCLGYKMAGYHVVWANEFIPEAQKTYRINFPDTFLNTSDIRDITADTIITESGINAGEIDIFDGSPPCAAFSMCGKREQSWGIKKRYSDTTQRVDDLFFEYIRLLRDLRPKCFIAENVDGLVIGVAKGYFKKIIVAMKDSGYSVSARVCDAAYLGVPQHRRRLIFVGVRNDLCEKYNVKPIHPTPLDYTICFGDAIAGVQNNQDEERMLNECQHYRSYQVAAQIPFDPSKNTYGSSVTDGSYFNLCRISMRAVAPTLLQASGRPSATGMFHPLYNRKLTINEYKRIMSLPDDYVLTGVYEKQIERMGRMVPPFMMRAIASCVQKNILDRIAE